jgi:type IV pilus assembly protein PilP
MNKFQRYIHLLCLPLLFAACEDDSLYVPPAGSTPARSKKKADKKKKVEQKAPPVEFTEGDFVESEESRDPFRDYRHIFAKKTKTDVDNPRKVKAPAFALDELRLTGIITRSRSRAMLTDGAGFGWVVYTGDYVGKAELVSTGGTDAQEVAINWRVDRIRPQSVVFIREDAAHPEIPPTTRELPLYPAETTRGGS